MLRHPLLARAQIRSLLLAAVLSGASGLLICVAFYVARPFVEPVPGGIWALCRWDCGWYEEIATRGYLPPILLEFWAGNYAFFAGFPAGVSLVMKATGLSFAAGGLILNAIYSLAFCWIVLNASEELRLRDREETVFFLLAFLLWPWSLYNHIPYSEMLFNLAALGTFVFWRRGNLVAAALFGIVLTATRPSGIVLPLVLLTELAIRERHGLLALMLRPDGRVRALGFMPFGFMAVVAAQFLATGDPLGFMRIQEFGWGHGFRDPIATAIAGLAINGESRYHMIGFLLASALLLVGVLYKRIPGALAAFTWLMPALALFSTPTSVSRFALALFPICLTVNILPRWMRLPLLVAFAAVQAKFVHSWINNEHWLV